MAPCPITGAAPRRVLEAIPSSLLVKLWRFYFGLDVASLFAGIERIELRESPCGLCYFDPPVTGDGTFYRALEAKLGLHAMTAKADAGRVEYRRAAGHVAQGAAVVEIGCGGAGLRRHLPGARYVGLDPFAPDVAGIDIRRESLADHAAGHAEHYDAAIAFQAVEHVADPLAFARDMARLIRPGGLLILGAPLHPSPATELPNNLLNAPPHHASWWSRDAFAALAHRLGLDPVEIAELPSSPHQHLLHRWHRWTPLKVGPRSGAPYFADRWGRHAALAAGWRLGRIATWLQSPPARARPIDVFLAARKPQ